GQLLALVRFRTGSLLGLVHGVTVLSEGSGSGRARRRAALGVAHGWLRNGHVFGIGRLIGELLQVFFHVLLVEHALSKVALAYADVKVPRGLLVRHGRFPSFGFYQEGLSASRGF